MDDASTDATPEIVAAYGDRVRHVRQERDRGSTGTSTTGSPWRGASTSRSTTPTTSTCRRSSSARSRGSRRIAARGRLLLRRVHRRRRARVRAARLPPEVRGGRPLDYAVMLNALLEHRTVPPLPDRLVRARVYREVGPVPRRALEEHRGPRDVAAHRAAPPDRDPRGAFVPVPPFPRQLVAALPAHPHRPVPLFPASSMRSWRGQAARSRPRKRSARMRRTAPRTGLSGRPTTTSSATGRGADGAPRGEPAPLLAQRPRAARRLLVLVLALQALARLAALAVLAGLVRAPLARQPARPGCSDVRHRRGALAAARRSLESSRMRDRLAHRGPDPAGCGARGTAWRASATAGWRSST